MFAKIVFSQISSWTYIKLFLLILIVIYLSFKFYKFIASVKNNIDLIDLIPGPICYNSLLGNIPLTPIFKQLKHIVFKKNIQHGQRKLSLSAGIYFLVLKLKFINFISKVAQDALMGFTKIYAKEKIFRIWVSWQPTVFLWNAETAGWILSDHRLLEKSYQYNFLHPWLGEGVLTSTGEKWRKRRKLLGQTFHYKMLHNFLNTFNRNGEILVEKLGALCNENNAIVNIVSLMSPCTLDIICGKFFLPN